MRFAERRSLRNARTVVSLGGGNSDVVATIELVLLIAFVVLGVWWFRRTNLYRAHRRARASGAWHWATNMDYRAGHFARDSKPVPPEHPGSDE
jgi:hypothetical protein